MVGVPSVKLKVYSRKELANGSRGPQRWNAFVDRHPSGTFWHREEWLDYCLDYEAGVTDRAFALVDERKKERPRVVALCPAIEKDKQIRMGHDPCIGPLVELIGWDSIKDTPEHNVSALHKLGLEIKNQLTGMEVQWRWNRFPFDYRNTILRIGQFVSDPNYISWRTAIVPIRLPMDGLTEHAYKAFNDDTEHTSESIRWSQIRKSYKGLINKAESKYLFLQGRESSSSREWSLWNHYQTVHKECAQLPRSNKSYEHQMKWLNNGQAIIFAVFPKGGIGNELSEYPGRVTSSLQAHRSTDGAGPSTSTTLACAYVIRYKDYYYYASGPSLEKDIQHALQWRIIQYVASQNGKAYELGWTDKQKDDPIGFFKRGFTNKHSHVDCLTGVITQ